MKFAIADPPYLGNGKRRYAPFHENSQQFDTKQAHIELVEKFKRVVEEYRTNGYKIVGYGAPAKGNTFLNFAKVPFDMIIDDNPMKQGLYTPGSSIGIVGSEVLKSFEEHDRILFVPLAWNFFKEIKERITAQRNNLNDVFLDMKRL